MTETNKKTDISNKQRKEVRIRNIGNARHQELVNASRYYGVSISTFVRHILLDYLKTCPVHIKEYQEADRDISY